MTSNPRGWHTTLRLVATVIVGSAVNLWGGESGSVPGFRQANAAETPRRFSVLPAVGSDAHGPAPIRLTAELLKEPAEAVKKKVDRLAQAVAPSPSAEPAEDPTSLRTKAKVSPELYIAAAQVHESAGRLAQAENAFQQAFRLAPKHLPTHLAYARFKDRQHQSREALGIYLRLVSEYPNEATLFNDLGMYYARRGMNQEAIAAFERAVQLQPKRLLYRNNLAVVLVQNDALEPALAQLLAVYTEPEACYKLGYLLQKKGDQQLALEYFGRALQLSPGMVEARQWYEHLQRQLASRAVPTQVRGRQGDSFPPPPADSPMMRTAQRSAPPSADMALPPSEQQPRAVGPTPEPGTRTPGTAPVGVSPARGAPVRQLPRMPRRLLSTDLEDAPSDEDLPPMPPPSKSEGKPRVLEESPPSAKADLPDPPLPPVSRAVRLPAVSPSGVRHVPPVGP